VKSYRRPPSALVLGLGALALLLLGIFVDPGPHVYTTDVETDEFLRANEGRYRDALAQTERWATGLRVDPEELQANGVKGKKKLVEALELWRTLADVADTRPHKRVLLSHIDELAAITRTDAYHDMLALDDEAFKQNATSYLRAAYLLDRLGLDTTRYREEIKRIQPRLDAQLVIRGANQRAAFATYYDHFGLTPPFSLKDALQHGVIASRRDVASFSIDDMYSLTHEVFVPFYYGDRLDLTPFDGDDLRWLRQTLARMADDRMARNDPDLLAEVVTCMRLVRAMDLPQYRRGLDYLLSNQSADGHWGFYGKERAEIGDLVVYKLELHTTMVTAQALAFAFHPAWNEAVETVAPPP
jgi:hypothetical protein